MVSALEVAGTIQFGVMAIQDLQVGFMTHSGADQCMVMAMVGIDGIATTTLITMAFMLGIITETTRITILLVEEMW